MSASKIRVLIGKPGLDGHDRGAKVVARALRDAGMEVIYSGLHRTSEELAAMAVQEDVDAIGISILSGAHMTLLPRLMECLASEGAGDVLVFAGGIIPPEDRQVLKDRGIAEVFGPGTPTEEIVRFLKERCHAGA